VTSVLKERIFELAEKVAAESGFSIYECVVQYRKKRLHIDVRIDNGKVVSHDDCTLYTRNFSVELDKIEEIAADYYLEVSSPGLKRKLRNIEELSRFVGAPVKIVYYKDETSTHTYKALLKSVEGSKLEVEENGKVDTLDYDKIKRANLDY
jgi:ribosome maturation factor RimP